MSWASYRRRLPNRSVASVVLWWILVRTALRVALCVVYRLRLYGRSNLPQEGPAIYVANHQSHLDPIMVACLTGPYASLARASLFDSRLLGWSLHGLGSIPLQQDRTDPRALRTAVGVLKAGGRMLIFPEGARTRDGAMSDFLRGMLILVRRSKAPIVPIAVEGAYDIWPASRKCPRLRGRLVARAGPAIAAEELIAVPPEEALDRLRRAIDTIRLELRKELRDRTGGRYPAPGLGDHPAG